MVTHDQVNLGKSLRLARSWHYSFKMDGTAPLDLPYGAEESESFNEPEGWDQPGWNPTGHGAH